MHTLKMHRYGVPAGVAIAEQNARTSVVNREAYQVFEGSLTVNGST